MRPNITWLLPAYQSSLPPPGTPPHTMPWITTPQAYGMLYLVSPLLVMLSPEGEAESLPSLKCDLPREAYLPCLPLLRMTIQSTCCGPLCGWHLSQSVTSQLRGPRGPANSVCPGSWCLDPSVSAAPYIGASLFWLLVKAENLTNLCAWVIWLPGNPFFSQLIIHAIKYLGRAGIVYWACSSQGTLVTLLGHHMLEWDYSAR